MFYNMYQPIMLGNSVLSYETLIRFKSGTVNLADYLSSIINKPLFDYNQIIRTLSENKNNDILLFINIYPASLLCDDFVSRLLLLKPFFHRFVLEIIEDDCECMNKLCANINMFRLHGLEFALDDFGAQFSNMSRLNRLDVKYVKIDRGLVSNIDTDYLSFSFLLNMCQLLGSERSECNIIIEGIETLIQHQLIDIIEEYTNIKLLRQGYYYSYPKNEFRPKVEDDENNDVANFNSVGLDFKVESINDIKKAYEKFIVDDDLDTALTEFNILKVLASTGAVTLSKVLENTPHMIILKNQVGDIIYHNRCSRDSFNIEAISLFRDVWLNYNPELKMCLEHDEELILSNQQSSIRLENINGYEFLVNRYLIKTDENKTNVLSIIMFKESVYLENCDILTGLYLRHDYSIYNDIKFVVFLDLDDLKAINDNISYEKGDEYLLSFSKSIKHTFNNKDYILIRHGGDEFVILCKNTDLEDLEFKLNVLTENNAKEGIRFSYGVAINSDDIFNSISISSSNMKQQKKGKKNEV